MSEPLLRILRPPAIAGWLCLIGLCVFIQACSLGQDPFVKALRDPDSRLLQQVADSIIDANYVVHYGTSWYHAALPILIVSAYEGRFDGVKAVLDKGADVNRSVTETGSQYWPEGLTALHAAADIGNARIVQLLLEHGANPNVRVRTMFGMPDRRELHKLRGLTPLMVAAIRGHVEVVRMLVEAGAMPNIREINNGHTASQLARNEGRIDIVQALQLADLQQRTAPWHNYFVWLSSGVIALPRPAEIPYASD